MVRPETMQPALYTPATHNAESLQALMHGENENVHRMVICTEDSVHPDDVDDAVSNLGTVFETYDPTDATEVFVRVRNPEVTRRILGLSGVEKITGFVVPKADPTEFPWYADMIIKADQGFSIMPILESPQMPDRYYREELLDVFSDTGYKSAIECLRIGANDLMGSQGMRRDDEQFTIYDNVIGSHLIGSIVNEYRGIGGFTITAPVFECFGEQYDALFKREVSQHIGNRLLGQTVIHPRHMALLQEAYKVRAADYESAKQLCANEVTAVVGHDGKMDEVTTHHSWAQSMLQQAEMFGLR